MISAGVELKHLLHLDVAATACNFLIRVNIIPHSTTVHTPWRPRKFHLLILCSAILCRSMGGNQLTGTLPAAWSKLPVLEYL
jgi:hypothetical protein